MRVERLGEGDPEIAVVGAIHGDEPCGARAIERLLADPPPVERPVALIVANEEALERGVRSIDADLNRSFRDPDPATHEGRLAERLAEELAGTTALSIHATQSRPTPFAIADLEPEPAASIAPRLSVEALVRVRDDEGRPFALSDVDVLEVEAGHQRSAAAAESAHRLALEFLAATGVCGEPAPARSPPVFEQGAPIEKPPAARYEVFVENFTRVGAGEAFAAADGEAIVADAPFYPILLSADGYETIFGYRGDRRP